MTYIDEPDEPREIHRSPGRLWLACFRGGPLDGTVEVREKMLPAVVFRRWYPMTKKQGPVMQYEYRLIQPVTGGWVEYEMVDAVPETPSQGDS